MSRLFLTITFIVTLSFAYLFCAGTPAFNENVAQGFSPAGDVTVLSDTDYFPAVLNAINGAKSDIQISMYLIQIDAKNTNDPAYKLTEALANAAKRGVKVKVVLENDKYKDNMAAFNMLSRAGASVYFDDPYGFVHDKIVVIDRSISIVGSHNWSELALSGNHDTSLLVRSPETADELISHISSIRLTQPYKLPADEGVAIPASFFKGKDNPCAKLFKNHADKLFDLYLLLLREGKPEFKAAYERLGKGIGLNREAVKDKSSNYYRYYYRDILRKFLATLDKDYGLIKYDSASDTVALFPRSPDTPTSSSLISRSPDILLPNSYWTYSWNSRLTFASKYFYLVALNESKGSGSTWWSLSREEFISKYGMNRESVSNAILELQKYDIIDIYRESAKKFDAFWMKEPNKYLLKALYDPMALRRSFLKLKQKYGVKIVEQAIGLAGELNTPNNLADVEKFVELIKTYGYAKVKAANAKTAALSTQNGKRHTGYTIKILEAE